MRPNLKVGDLVIARYSDNLNDPASFNSLRVGEIILLGSPGINVGSQDITIVHRVVQTLTLAREEGLTDC